MFISLGNNCVVKHQIKRYCGDGPTLFFDWLLTDSKCVMKVFQMYNKIDDIINHESIIKNINNNNKNDFKITTIPWCISLHDFTTKELSYEDKLYLLISIKED